jgi:DNA polymerase elongation subunit (family B)
MRGQGIKLTSYIAKKCREKDTLMPVIDKGSSDDGYEGAIVLDPKCDLYLDNPVACVDYASLYPSSMLSENLSHDSKVWTREYDLANNLIEETGEKDNDGNFIYDNLPDYKYVDCTYDTYTYIRKTPSAAAEKVKCGRKVCRFAQFPNGERGVMPSILEELLKARKSTRKLIPTEKDEFMKNVLDKRQLGYKLTANSLYGQCGAKTSTFYEKDVAASTTSTGRKLLTYAKRILEECYGNRVCSTKHGEVKSKAEYIYGDTDSVFFTFNLEELDGTPIRGKKALEITIELAQEAGELASTFLKGPHDLEYEKTFMPFCLLSKKRYVGMLYELDPDKCKRKEMGIVLKRRDNAPIVKDIYGGIIDILMKEKDIQKAISFLKSCLQDIVDEKYPMDKLVITKSLRSGYKNPNQIAHKVLADRITARDPGNKPSPGDRIPFVYIHNTKKTALQGEKIETPNYIIENNVKIDYSFYITNQIMKPVQQVFALVLEKIWMMQNKMMKIRKFKREVEAMEKKTDPEKMPGKLETMKNKEVKALLFEEYLRVTNNSKMGMNMMSSYFTIKT